jgi:PKD repeat protein
VRYNFCANEVTLGGENPRNYMDYHANSTLPNEFTPGQMARCLMALQDPTLDRRFNLYRAANLEATGCGAWGRVRAYFWAPLQRVTVGQPLRFQEYCMGQPHSYRWEFEGGTPATSTAPNPTVSWAAPGTYSVKLVVENQSGRKDSLLREDFITVAGAPVNLPLGEDFSGNTFPPAGWQLLSQDVTSVVQPGWQRRADVGAYGFNDGCAELPFHQNQNRNTTDWLVLPPATLPANNAALSFEVAYSPLRIAEDAPIIFIGAGLQMEHTFTDTLAVEVSVDGGTTWHTAWKKGGEALMTTASVNTTVSAAADYVFVPGEDDWRYEIADLRPWGGQQAIVRLAGKNGYGNFLYVDDLTLGENPQVSRSQRQPLAGVRAYPNPATRHLTVQLAQPLLHPASVQLTDALGRPCVQQLLPAGDTRLQLGLQTLPAGLYMLQVDTPIQQKRLRIVKQ